MRILATVFDHVIIFFIVYVAILLYMPMRYIIYKIAEKYAGKQGKSVNDLVVELSAMVNNWVGGILFWIIVLAACFIVYACVRVLMYKGCDAASGTTLFSRGVEIPELLTIAYDTGLMLLNLLSYERIAKQKRVIPAYKLLSIAMSVISCVAASLLSVQDAIMIAPGLTTNSLLIYILMHKHHTILLCGYIAATLNVYIAYKSTRRKSRRYIGMVFVCLVAGMFVLMHYCGKSITYTPILLYHVGFIGYINYQLNIVSEGLIPYAWSYQSVFSMLRSGDKLLYTRLIRRIMRITDLGRSPGFCGIATAIGDKCFDCTLASAKCIRDLGKRH